MRCSAPSTTPEPALRRRPQAGELALPGGDDDRRVVALYRERDPRRHGHPRVVVGLHGLHLELEATLTILGKASI